MEVSTARVDELMEEVVESDAMAVEVAEDVDARVDARKVVCDVDKTLVTSAVADADDGDCEIMNGR